MKVRIVERTHSDGRKQYVIQQPHWLIRWWWVDAWLNSWCGAACVDHFSTLDEARRHLRYFAGTKVVDTAVPADACHYRSSGVTYKPGEPRTVLVTFDEKGTSVWPSDVSLVYSGGEWYNVDCNIRGTDGLDQEGIQLMLGRDHACKPGSMLVLRITEMQSVT